MSTVFPARAGMSPGAAAPQQKENSVPRASGDEPETFQSMQGIAACSPRERG